MTEFRALALGLGLLKLNESVNEGPQLYTPKNYNVDYGGSE